MVRFVRSLASAVLIAGSCMQGAGAQSVPASSATPAVSLPATIFQPAYRSAIDSRCPKARTGADAIAADLMSADLNLINATEQAFIECSKLSRLPQAKDQTLYMQLAAATCFYLIGIRTTGATRKAALEYAHQIALVLAPPSNDRRQMSAGAGDSAGGGGSGTGTTGLVSNNAVHINETANADDGLGSSYDPAVLRTEAADLRDLIEAATPK